MKETIRLIRSWLIAMGFEKAYFDGNKNISPEKQALSFELIMEEVGEVAKAFRKEEPNLPEEIMDAVWVLLRFGILIFKSEELVNAWEAVVRKNFGKVGKQLDWMSELTRKDT